MKFWAATVSVVLVAAVVAGAAGVPAGASVPAIASARGWSVTPSPNPVIPAGQLFWVSCPAASSCLAVGTYTKASGAGVTLAERWNGSTWRIQPTPSPAGAAWSNLFGVSCVSPSACEAVGVTASRSGALTALAERWNGSSWQIQHAPSPAGGGQLNAVSCTSPSACTAVGGTPPGTPRKALAERWNGRSWQIQPAPSPAGAFLSGVACTSSSACTAVGGSDAGTLAERWNGTRWSTQATANKPQGGGALFSVACTSRSACTAAGISNAGNLAERWNGASWKIQRTPNPGGAQVTFLNTVSCASASACIAAGAYIDSSGAFQGLAERWNGRSWAIQPIPRLPGGAMNLLIGIACTSGTGCTAVGYSSPNPSVVNHPSPATLAERWDGSAWRVQHTPNPPGAAASNLNAASCVSRSACIAVGNTSNSRGTPLTLAQRWNGHSWRIQPIPSPADGGNLLGVSCPSRSSCLAVGGHGNPFNEVPPGTLAERWNGHTWSVQATPNPAGAQNITLGSVACPVRTVCTAFGLNHIGSSPLTLAERWSGGRWRLQPTPGLVANDSGLQGVACPTVSACFAVAAYTNNGSILTLAEQWNRAGASTQAATGRPVAPGALPHACLRARMPGSLPISGRISAVAGSRFRAGSFPNWADAPTPASHSYERGKA